ncbi:MAG: S49 family peptidase [Pseudomonadota bacterium]
MIRKLVGRIPFLRKFGDAPPIVPVVRMSGVIAESGRFASALNLAGVAQDLQKAFSVSDAKAVAIIINSPGGSPVQSGLIFSRIRSLAAEKEKTVFVFAEDVAASGGYLIALAGDEIFVHDASVVGSIGVISAGFGFVDLIEKIGVERRVYTSGESKSMLDPFKPENGEDIDRLKSLQSDIHEYFKSLVRDRRGDKLKAPRKQLFSGEVWVGKKAVTAGLVDGVGDVRSVLRERYGDDVLLPIVNTRRRFKLPFATQFQGPGSGFAADLLRELRAQHIWSRFGL